MSKYIERKFDEDTGTPLTGPEREWGWRCPHCKEELPDDYDDPDNRPTFRFCFNCGHYMSLYDEDIQMHYESHIVTEFYYNPIVTEFYDVYATCGYDNIKEEDTQGE